METWPVWLESKGKYKYPEIDSGEMEIYRLLDKEFKIMILGSICYKRTQIQLGKLMHEQNENTNKMMQIIKNNQKNSRAQ